jgi:hypothetical protein
MLKNEYVFHLSWKTMWVICNLQRKNAQTNNISRTFDTTRCKQAENGLRDKIGIVVGVTTES